MVEVLPQNSLNISWTDRGSHVAKTESHGHQVDYLYVGGGGGWLLTQPLSLLEPNLGQSKPQSTETCQEALALAYLVCSGTNRLMVCCVPLGSLVLTNSMCLPY